MAPAVDAPTESAPVSNAVKKTVPATVKAVAPPIIVASSNDINKGGKNIEVFSQGKKIMDSNGSNISDLPEGTYLIKVTNGTPKK
ncbi:hypothetical protein D3C85_1777880 [compost metagenome]